MPSLRTLYVIIVSLVLAQIWTAPPTFGLPYTLLFATTAVIAVTCFAKFTARRILRLPSSSLGEPIRWGTALEESCGKVQRLWCCVYPVLLIATGVLPWAVTFKEAGWNLVFALLLFGPHLLLCIALEWNGAQIDAYFGERLYARWRLRLRIGEFTNNLICLTPLFMISAAQDFSASGGMQWIPLWGKATLGVLVILTVVAMYPTVLGRWMGAQALPDGSLVDQVEALLNATKIRGCRVLVINSGGNWDSAAIVGWIPWGRQLWLGDGVLNKLSPAEVDMVLLHELSHVLRFHFLHRLLPLLWSSLAGAAVMLSFGWLSSTPWLQTGLAMGAAAGALLFGMSIVSKSCELEADDSACDLALKHCEWANGSRGEAESTLISALQKLTPEYARRGGLMHPSLHERRSSLAKRVAERQLTTT